MSLLKPTELAELKKLAGANLESALIAAARIGATRSGTVAKPIKRASEILEFEAESIRACHTIGSVWHDTEAKQEHDEFKRVAKALRGLLAAEEAKEGE